jgi:hypothetical protein
MTQRRSTVSSGSRDEQSSLYYYFDDKADLFTTMIERARGFLLREVGGFDIDAG